MDPWHHNDRSAAIKQECPFKVTGSPKLPIETLTAAEGTPGRETKAEAGRVKADEGMKSVGPSGGCQLRMHPELPPAWKYSRVKA